jgi:hypothetical protein
MPSAQARLMQRAVVHSSTGLAPRAAQSFLGFEFPDYPRADNTTERLHWGVTYGKLSLMGCAEQAERPLATAQVPFIVAVEYVN